MSEPHETRLPVGKPIFRYTLRISKAHLEVAPPPSQLRTHVVDLAPSDDEAPPGVTDALSTFIGPLAATATVFASTFSIVAAISTLSTQITNIHTNLVKRIGSVNEHVDLIVERQTHDIVLICDTL